MELVNQNGQAASNEPVKVELTVLENAFDWMVTFVCADQLTGINIIHQWMEGKKVFIQQLMVTPMMKPHPLMQGQGTVFFHYLVMLRKEEGFHSGLIDAVGRMAADIAELRKSLGALAK